MASKAEETYKRIRQILSAAFLLLHPDYSGDESEVRIAEDHRLRVTQYEHLVLEAAGYNFAIRHAHEVLLELAGEWRLVGPVEKAVEMVRIFEAAFGVVRQVYWTPVVLCYPPEHIALAALMHVGKEDPKLLCRIADTVADLRLQPLDLESFLGLLGDYTELSSLI